MDGEFIGGGESLLPLLERWTGTTVTIYTTSGGASGCGYTGVLVLCNPLFVRLITCIGPAPCCSLGSSCMTPGCPVFNNAFPNGGRIASAGGMGGGFGGYGGYGGFGGGVGGFGGIANVGAVVDIPISRIAAFVHNAV